MHTILRLIKNHRPRRFKDFICTLHLSNAEFLTDLFSNLCIQIMKRRKAVGKNCLRPCIIHYLSIYLIRGQIPNPSFPYLLRFAHGYPHVCVNYISSPCSCIYILSKRNDCTRLLCRSFTPCCQILIREIRLWRTCRKMHSHFRTGDHQGIAHIITGISHIHQLHSPQSSQMLFHCQKRSQHLGGMIFIG